MIVKFKRVAAGNFRSFKDFAIDLSDSGITLVQGKIVGGSETLESNGAGKSSIFSALSFALFGKVVHVSGSKVSGDKVVRRQSQGEGCVVNISLSTEDHELEIIRYRSHPKHGDKIHLIVDGTSATQSSNPKTQQLIEALLGITPELFFNLIYVTEATLRESFAFESDAQRKKILVGALPQFQQFNKARAAVKDSLNDYTDSTRKLEMELNGYEMAATELVSAAQRVDTSTTEARISEILALKAVGVQSQSLLQKQVFDLKKRIKVTECNFHTLERGVEQRSKVCTRIQQSVVKMFDKQKRLKATIQKFSTLTGVCPTCEQIVPPDHVDIHKAFYLQQLHELEDRIDKATDLSGKAMDKYLSTKSYCDSERQNIQNLKQKLSNAETQINQIVFQLRSEQSELDRLYEFMEQVSVTSLNTQSRLFELSTRIGELKVLINTAKQFEGALRNWLEGFGPRGVVSHGLNQVLVTLTEKTEQWLWRLWHEGASFQFEFSGDDLSKIEAKLFLNQVLVDVESLSSGETRRLCLAICFGLREALQTLVGWRSNLMVLDEVFDGLDSVGRSKVLHELKMIPNLNTFVISQFPQLSEDIDRTIEVTFSSGISTLKQL